MDTIIDVGTIVGRRECLGLCYGVITMSMVRISDDIYRRVKEIAEKSGKSIKDIVEEAIQIYLLGKSGIENKEIRSVKEKWIVVKFKSRCSKCNMELQEGDIAYWIRVEYEDGSSRSFIYCSDCYFVKIDRSLAKRFMKVKELEAVKRGLQKEIEDLMDKVKDLQEKYEVSALKREIFEFYRAFQESFNGVIDSNNFSKIQEFLERLMDLADRINRIESAIGLKEIEKPIPKKELRKERVY